MNPVDKNTPRRGRPARSLQQIESSRDMIIQAARDLFAAHGYAGVSMRKIAAKAECLPSTLYTLFPNKKQLLHFIWESVFADLIRVLELSYKQSPTETKLEDLCFASIDFWMSRPTDYLAIFLVEDVLDYEDARHFVERSEMLPRLEIFTHAIIEAQQKGQLKAGDPEEIKNILLCCIQGVVFNLITIPEYPWGNHARLKTLMIGTLLDGLK